MDLTDKLDDYEQYGNDLGLHIFMARSLYTYPLATRPCTSIYVVHTTPSESDWYQEKLACVSSKK